MEPMTLSKHGLPYIVQGTPKFSPDGEWLVSIEGPVSGAVSGDHWLTLDQPIPEGIKEAYYCLPASALHEGSRQGWYRIEFETTTRGKVCEFHRPQECP
jgi:hypothetical protein